MYHEDHGEKQLVDMVMVESNLLLLAHNTFTVMEYLPLPNTDSMVHND